MRNLRVPVIAAWVFCAVVIVASLVRAVSLSAQASSGQDLLIVNELIWSLLVIPFAIPAALIITRQPRNIIGWLLMTLPLTALPIELIDRHLKTFPSPPAPTIPLLLMMTISGLSWVALIFPILLIPLYFPTGRLLSPRWRWVVNTAVVMIFILLFFSLFSREFWTDSVPWRLTNPYGFLPPEAEQYFMIPWSLMLAALTFASLASIFVRYRRAAAVEREQMKWLLYASAVFGLIYMISMLFFIGDDSLNQSIGFTVLFIVSIAAIPVTITIAILRYHLFDIDVIIRLTIVYAIVTALLGLVYAGGVALLQVAFGSLTGQTSELAVLVTTLAIAALFNPLRLRVQETINRRFYRQKYDVEQALNEFANAARTGSDLEALAGMLTELVAKTLEPAQVHLYMKRRAKNGEGE